MSQWTHVDGERTRAIRFTTIYEVKFRWCSDISTWGLYSLIETARDAVHREVMPRYESQYAAFIREGGGMSDLIAIQIGAAPWCPAANAEAVREYHYHDFPLTGVLRQQNVEYLFFCLTGQDEPYNYWAYIRVAPETRAYLEAATSSTDFDERFEALNFNGPAVLAFAGDAYGILGFAELDMH